MKAALILILAFTLPATIFAAGGSMPLTSSNLINCAIRMQQAIESVTQQEQQALRGNVEFSKKVVAKIVVQPISQGVYDYDKTVLAIAKEVATSLPSDPMHRQALLFIFTSIYASSNHLTAYGFIKQPTKLALEHAAAKLQ